MGFLLPRARGLVGGGDETDDRAAERRGALGRDDFVEHGESAVGTDTGRGIRSHERVGRVAVGADVDGGMVEARPWAGGRVGGRDADALVVTVNPFEALRGDEAVADIAHVVEA